MLYFAKGRNPKYNRDINIQMKLYQILFFLTIVFTTQLVNGQTIVSTSTQSKNAVIEEFGGIYCVWCPEGHQIIRDLKAAHPEKVVHLNFHVGDYAVPQGNDPDFRTTYGVPIFEQTGSTGYPSATINRKVFNGLEQGNPGTTAISRWNWETAVTAETNQDAIVNIAATATINTSTNMLEIYTEYYYTGSSSFPTNKLQVAVLQNEVYGPQIGGNSGSTYAQENLFRTFLTGQWGETISETNAGTLGSRSFSYLLPENVRNVALDKFNIKIAIFISENNQQILNGIEVTPTYQIANDIDMHAIWLKGGETICQESLNPKIKVKNEGNTPISSFLIDYNIGGYQWQTSWTGNLPSLSSTIIELPEIPIENLPLDTTDFLVLTANISMPNNLSDQNPPNNQTQLTFNIAPHSESPNLILNIQTDLYAYDTYWEILDESEDVIFSGGNPIVQGTGGGQGVASPLDVDAYSENQSIIEYIDLPDAGCYTFRILDDYGDGICCAYGWGYYELIDPDGHTIIEGSSFANIEEKRFKYSENTVETIETVTDDNYITLSPVPATNGQLFYDIKNKLVTANNYAIQISNLSGKTVLNQTRVTPENSPISGEISLAPFSSGIYFFHFISDGQCITKRFIITQ